MEADPHKIEKTTQALIFFQEKQYFVPESAIQALQSEKEEQAPQLIEAVPSKTTIIIEKEQIQEADIPKRICAPAETTINPAFHTTLQTIKSIALEIKEKLQKQAVQK